MTELVSSPLAPLVRAVYRLLGGSRRWTVARGACRLLQNLERGPFFTASVRQLLRDDFGVDVGAYSFGDCLLPGAFAPQVTVGRYCSVAEGVRAYTQDHPIERLSTHPFFYERRDGATLPRQSLRIGHDVWLGCNAIVTAGCQRIGDGAVVAAGAVVTHDVDEFCIVAGVPARPLRYRFDESVRQRIRASGWWHRPIDELRAHPDLLSGTAPDLCASNHPLLAGARD